MTGYRVRLWFVWAEFHWVLRKRTRTWSQTTYRSRNTQFIHTSLDSGTFFVPSKTRKFESMFKMICKHVLRVQCEKCFRNSNTEYERRIKLIGRNQVSSSKTKASKRTSDVVDELAPKKIAKVYIHSNDTNATNRTIIIWFYHFCLENSQWHCYVNFVAWSTTILATKVLDHVGKHDPSFRKNSYNWRYYSFSKANTLTVQGQSNSSWFSCDWWTGILWANFSRSKHIKTQASFNNDRTILCLPNQRNQSRVFFQERFRWLPSEHSKEEWSGHS